MAKITVTPLKEVNGVKFGMKRDEVRKILGTFKGEFKKTPFSKTTTDDFGFCHVYYDTDGGCEAVEIFDNTEVVVERTTVFPIDMEKAKQIFSDLTEEDGSFISKSQSVGIYAPYGNMESILFGIPGYYD